MWLKKNRMLYIVGVCIVIIGVMLTGCKSFFGGDDDDNPTSPGEASPTPLPEGVLISESLKDYQTVGDYADGDFTDEGLQFRGIFWHLRYSIPTTPNGYIEFTAKGFEHDEYHRDAVYQDQGEFKSYLVTMWSGTDGYDHDTAQFIYEIRKYGLIQGRPDASNSIVFTITSNGVFRDNFYFRLGWDPNVAYRFRVEWSGGETRLYRDGILVGTCPYRADFSPTDHQVQIGANLLNPKPYRRKEAPGNLLISDVVIGTL